MRAFLIATLCLIAFPMQAQTTSMELGPALVMNDSTIIATQAVYTESAAALRVYQRDAEGWQLAATHVIEGVADDDNFGSAMALDGDLLAVGADGADDDKGVVYVFERSEDGAWEQIDMLVHDDDSTQLGADLSLQGRTLVVGAPGVNRVLIVRDLGLESKSQQLVAADGSLEREDMFGASVAYDGDRLYVGAPGRDSLAGAVYIFGMGESGFTQEAVLTSPGRKKFGKALHVRAPNSVIATAPGLSLREMMMAGQRSFTLSGLGSGPIVELGLDETDQWIQTVVVDSLANRWLQMEAAIPLVVRNEQLFVGMPGQGGMVQRYSRAADGGSWSVSQEIAGLGDEAGFGSVIAASNDQLAVLSPEQNYGMGVITALELADDGVDRTGRMTLVNEVTLIRSGRVDCEEGEALHFGCGRVDLLSFLPISDLGGEAGVSLNDVWGWTDPQTGAEYALVGRTNGTSFVDISNPSAPVLVGDLPLTDGANPSSWRDIKVYKDHAFIVADNAGPHGMQVFDLAMLRETVDMPAALEAKTIYRGVRSAHNVIINEATGFAFLVGFSAGGEHNCASGLHMVNIQDPANPFFAGCFTDTTTEIRGAASTHDAQCVTYAGPDTAHLGREICFSSNAQALSIADVTNKEDPVALASVSYPGIRYAHQGWLTEDQQYFYLNDEIDELGGTVDRTRTLIWDVSDLDDPILASEFLADNRASDHNLYIRGNLMYQSNYGSGLRIFDITDVLNPVEVGFFDTITMLPDEPGFIGSWSNYPYFESGTIVVTSIDEGLFLVRMQALDL